MNTAATVVTNVKYALGFSLVVVLIVWFFTWVEQPPTWTAAEFETLESLRLDSLPPLISDPTNRVADDPDAAKLGHHLFFDKRLSITGTISCATCHQPELNFTDGLTRGVAIGLTRRHTPSIVGGAYSPWQYWDGRKDSQWSQALAPLEDPAEHGGNRVHYVRLIAAHYRHEYESIFGSLPDLTGLPDHAGPVINPDWNNAWQAMTESDKTLINTVFANIGKAIAAYERLLMPGPTRFDNYIADILAGVNDNLGFSYDEIAGLRLFIGKGDCTQCHNGPLLTNNEFHNTGVVSAPGEIPDKGRVQGVRDVVADPFNCQGPYADSATSCAELRFAKTGTELIGAMRTPSLRTMQAPFLHKGQLTTLKEVLQHYNEALPSMIGHNEAKPLDLTRREIEQLEAFLETLSAPLATAPHWLSPPE